MPVYAIVNNTGPGEKEITYWTFYPYNRGKRVCIGMFINNIGCAGGYSTFGNHVGDWERVRVKLVNGQPQWYYLYIHDSDITKRFGGKFYWNGREFSKDEKMITLKMTWDGHPIVYSADGSHGIWPFAGKHVYKNLHIDTLSDYTGEGGISWNTWNNLKIVTYNKERKYDGEFQFLEYIGRWGNPADGCANPISPFSGECILNDGPKGPPK